MSWTMERAPRNAATRLRINLFSISLRKLCTSQPKLSLCVKKVIKQQNFSTAGFELATKRTRKREFLDEMNLVIPWV